MNIITVFVVSWVSGTIDFDVGQPAGNICTSFDLLQIERKLYLKFVILLLYRVLGVIFQCALHFICLNNANILVRSSLQIWAAAQTNKYATVENRRWAVYCANIILKWDTNWQTSEVLELVTAATTGFVLAWFAAKACVERARSMRTE